MTKSTPVENQPAATNSSGTTPPPPAENDHHHGHFMQALKITLVQIGINISSQNGDASTAVNQNNNTPAETTNTGSTTSENPVNTTDNNDLTQALHAFMHTMLQAMRALISESNQEKPGEQEGDHDDDDGGQITNSQPNGYSSVSTQVDALLQSVKADNTTPAATTDAVTTSTPSTPATTDANPVAPTSTSASNPLDDLRKAFASLLEAMNTPNNNTAAPVTLQSFLESLVNNLTSLQTSHQSLTISGAVINISV